MAEGGLLRALLRGSPLDVEAAEPSQAKARYEPDHRRGERRVGVDIAPRFTQL